MPAHKHNKRPCDRSRLAREAEAALRNRDVDEVMLEENVEDEDELIGDALPPITTGVLRVRWLTMVTCASPNLGARRVGRQRRMPGDGQPRREQLQG